MVSLYEKKIIIAILLIILLCGVFLLYFIMEISNNAYFLKNEDLLKFNFDSGFYTNSLDIKISKKFRNT